MLSGNYQHAAQGGARVCAAFTSVRKGCVVLSPERERERRGGGGGGGERASWEFSIMGGSRASPAHGLRIRDDQVWRGAGGERENERERLFGTYLHNGGWPRAVTKLCNALRTGIAMCIPVSGAINAVRGLSPDSDDRESADANKKISASPFGYFPERVGIWCCRA